MAGSTLPATLPFTLGEEGAEPSPPEVKRPTASWEWLLCDGKGNPLADLTTAAGKQLIFKRNYYTEAQFVISHEDAAAYPLLEAVRNGPFPTLRCYRRLGNEPAGVLRFNGYLAPFSETLQESGLITAIFRSPFGQLIGDGTSSSGRYTSGGITAEEKYADDIAVSLIKLYGGAGNIGEADPTFNEQTYSETHPVGLKIGNTAKTQLRFITYRHQNVGQAIIYLSQMLEGFDFDETFVEQGETLALFNTYQAQGTLKEGARFQYGPGTLANVSKVERVTSSPINKVRLIGGQGILAETEAEMAESQAKYGKWETQQATTGTTILTFLEARAKALRRAFPVKTFRFEPDLAVENCPKPWDDFWLGDTVPFYGRRGAFEENLVMRLNEITIVIDENGYETATIPDPHALSAEDREIRTDLLHTNLTFETSQGS